MGSPLGPSGYTTSGVPGILTGNDGSLPSMVDNTQAKVTADYQAQTQQSTGWNSASSNFFGGILSGFPNVNGLVTAAIDTFLANLCDAITGATGGLINLNGWASSLRADASAALTNTSTIASGVTSNITGSAPSDASVDVGPAVQLLNATVQASGTAPRIDIFNRSATWNKPAGMTTGSLILTPPGGGGAIGGLAYGQNGAAGGGGGPGGPAVYNGIAASSLLSTESVVVPLGASGAGGQGAEDGDVFNRANSLSLGANWRTDSGSQSAQIASNVAQAFTPSTYVGETGCWNARTLPLETDNYVIWAQLASPTNSLATDNYTGLYCAAPVTSYTSSTVLVAFVGNTGAGCGIITQTNAPSGAYIANGAQTGQAIQAQATTKFSTTAKIALTRSVDPSSGVSTFTGYINGVQAVSWVDTGKIVPSGTGFRNWGIITETNWPTFQSLYDSPAIASVNARDVSWISMPGEDGGTISFGSYSATGGKGGVGGGVDASGTRRPATGSWLNTDASWTGAAGTGTQSTSAAGGCGAAGQTGYLPNGEAGGGGTNTGGGAAGTSSSLDGQDGTSPTGGLYGQGSGAGGGFHLPLGSTGRAGQGGKGGFPGGGGGGGGATLDGLGNNGPGNAGGDAQAVMTSYFT